MTPGAKFMQSLPPQVYNRLRRRARQEGLTVQELIRAVVIPQWTDWDEMVNASIKHLLESKRRKR